MKRTDLGLSDKLNKKGKLSKHTQTWMKRLANSSGSLYSRPLGKPKGYLPEEQFREDYDSNAADEKQGKLYGKKIHKKAIKDDPINAFWHKRVSKAYGDEAKRLNKKAVTGLDEEQLDEISGAKARKAEHKSAEKYYDAYDDETRARRKAIKDKTPESKEAAEKAKEKREKAAKRTIRFQNYADKKSK